MAKMFFMHCPHCGNKFGKIVEGALVVECQECGRNIYIKCNKDVLTVREADDISYETEGKMRKCAI